MFRKAQGKKIVMLLLVTGLLLLSGVFIIPTVVASGESFVIIDISAAGCGVGQFSMNVAIVSPDVEEVLIRTIVESGGEIYMDELANIFINQISLRSWGLFDNNSGGTQTQPFPIPAGQPVSIYAQFLVDTVPVWQSTLEIADCASGVPIRNTTGPVDAVTQNYGFEDAGASAAIPAVWLSPDLGSSKRVCNSEVPGVAHTGECAFQFTAGAAKTVLSQIYPILGGNADDQAILNAWVAADNLAASAKILGKVKFDDGTKIKLLLDIPTGTYPYQQLIIKQNHTGEVKSLKTKIQMGAGSGKLTIDDVALLIAANAGTPPVIAVVPNVLPLPSTGSGNSQ